MTSSSQQLRFWNELVQLRGHIEYLTLYHLHCEYIDRWIQIAIAVSSSGSIATWAVWGEYPLLWASIIAAGQFLMVVKSHLPFQIRMKATADLASRLEGLFVQWEGCWQQVADGELTEGEINSTITRFKRSKADLLDAHLKHVSLPGNEKLLERGERAANRYFEVVYNTGGENGKDAIN
jgi:hypothetical protein